MQIIYIIASCLYLNAKWASQTYGNKHGFPCPQTCSSSSFHLSKWGTTLSHFLPITQLSLIHTNKFLSPKIHPIIIHFSLPRLPSPRPDKTRPDVYVFCQSPCSWLLPFLKSNSIFPLSNIPCIHVLQLLHPVICWWTSRLLPQTSYCNRVLQEHLG